MSRCILASLLSLVAMLAASPPAAAATLWVTRAGDIADVVCPSEDRCTLRGAAQGASSGDEIRFSSSLGEAVVIDLQSPLTLDREVLLTVQGPGSDRLVIRPAGLFRPLVIAAGTVTLADLTVRDGVFVGANGANGGTAGEPGAPGAAATGGCILVTTALPVTLVRVAVRNCSVIGGNGGNGAAGFSADRGAGGTGGSGGSGGSADGAGIGVNGDADVTLLQSSVSGSVAAGGRGGSGGRGGDGSLGGGSGGSGGRGGFAYAGGISVQSTRLFSTDSLYLENTSLLENGLVGGDGGAGGAGGRSSGAGASGVPGGNGVAGELTGGNLLKLRGGRMTLVHATLGPTVLERGVPGAWDGVSETGRSVIRSESVAAREWRVRASAIVGMNLHSLCGGDPPLTWEWSGSNAASSAQCLQDGSILVDVTEFVDGMNAKYEHGRALTTPTRTSRLVDTAGACGLPVDQSGNPRPADGNGDGLAACDRGAVELEYSVDVFADGFER